MSRAASLFAAFLTGAGMALVGFLWLKPVQARVEPVATATAVPTALPTSTVTPTVTPLPTFTPTVTPITAAEVTSAGGMTFGWTGEVQCHNCAPFKVHIQLHHYDPTEGDWNCFDWSEEFQYCMSPTSSWIPWESVWGFGAACPQEWPFGSWVDIPGVGAFVCFDHGDLIYCTDDKSFCTVDLLGPGGAEWDGKEFDATLWVPLKPRK